MGTSCGSKKTVGNTDVMTQRLREWVVSPPILLSSPLVKPAQSLEKSAILPWNHCVPPLQSLPALTRPRPLSWKDSQALGRKEGPCGPVGKSSLWDRTFLRLSGEPLGLAAAPWLSSEALLWRRGGPWAQRQGAGPGAALWAW